MQTKLSQVLRDTDNTKWDSTAIKYFLNLAVQEFAEFLSLECGGNWFIASTDTNIVSGTQEYSLPADCLAVREFEWRGGSYNYALQEVQFRDRHSRETANLVPSDFSYRWYIRNNKVGISPTPAQNYTAGLRTHYHQQHTTLSSDGDTPDFPTNFHFAPIYRAAMHALHLDEEDDSQIVREWALAKLRAKRTLSRRVRSGTRYVKDHSDRGR